MSIHRMSETCPFAQTKNQLLGLGLPIDHVFLNPRRQRAPQLATSLGASDAMPHDPRKRKLEKREGAAENGGRGVGGVSGGRWGSGRSGVAHLNKRHGRWGCLRGRAHMHRGIADYVSFSFA